MAHNAPILAQALEPGVVLVNEFISTLSCTTPCVWVYLRVLLLLGDFYFQVPIFQVTLTSWCCTNAHTLVSAQYLIFLD